MKKNLRKIMAVAIIAVVAFVSGCGKTQQEAVEATNEQEAVEATTEQVAEAATQEAVEAATEQTAEAATQEAVAEEGTTEEAVEVEVKYDEKTHRVYFPDGLYFNWEHEDAPTEEELEDLLQFWKEHTE